MLLFTSHFFVVTWVLYLFSDESKQRLFVRKPSSRRSAVDQFISLPCQIVAYLVAHTFGIRMVYPGSISLLAYIMSKLVINMIMRKNVRRF